MDLVMDLVMDHALKHPCLSLPLHTGCWRPHAHGKAPKVLKLVDCSGAASAQFWSKCGMCTCMEIRSGDDFRLSPYRGRKK